MLITGPLFLVHPYNPEDSKNGFTVTTDKGVVVAHCTSHEAAMAAARLMAMGPNFGPIFKDGSQ